MIEVREREHVLGVNKPLNMLCNDIKSTQSPGSNLQGLKNSQNILSSLVLGYLESVTQSNLRQLNSFAVSLA